MHNAAVRAEIQSLIAAGDGDSVIARRTGIPRSTVRDVRRARQHSQPLCPRCWRPARPMRFTTGEYAELLGLYLGDGCIAEGPRTQRLRISLDARYPQIIQETAALLASGFSPRSVGIVKADAGATIVLSVYAQHLGCLLPQHGPGKKHDRPIRLEPWQGAIVVEAPWSLLRGFFRSDGCAFINRTGPYRYLSYDFCNRSEDILDLFCAACDLVGVRYSRAADRVRICRRSSVGPMAAFVGLKR